MSYPAVVQLRPDILVLGSGGVVGEAWLTGVLAGIEDAAGFDLRRCEYFIGTSAGAVVAARLAAGERPRRPLNGDAPGSGLAGPDPGTLVAGETDGGREPQLSVAAVARSALTLAERTVGTAAERAGSIAAWSASAALSASAPIVPAGLALAAPGGALARAVALRVMPRPLGEFAELREELVGLSARFDGRLRVVAVARDSGRRTVFGQPHAPHPRVADAVEASCALPWLVGPVQIDGIEYVDGGIWSPTNLDVAPAKRDTQVLCLSPTAGLFGPRRLDVGPLSPVGRRLSRSITLLESAALRGRHAAVRLITPDEEAAAAIGADLMDSRRGDRALRSGYHQGLRLSAQPKVRRLTAR